MESKWSDAESASYIARFAAQSNEDIALRVYTSRLIGQEPNLVLHGGGNTSVKTQLEDDLGNAVEVLCVKGSGWDLAAIEPAGLPAVRLQALQALRNLDALSDEAMVNAQRIRMLTANAPNPSVETLLHAFLPHKFIDHSHADAILALVDQPRARQLCEDAFGKRLAIVPYIMPGFALAKLAVSCFEAQADCEGLLLLQHGLFTFGATARESYERHIRFVDLAERFIRSQGGSTTPHNAESVARVTSEPPREDFSVDFSTLGPQLRGALTHGGRRPILHLRTSPQIRAFVDHPELPQLSAQGCATPDHVIRTKRLPLVLSLPKQPPPEDQQAVLNEAIDRYRDEYRAYVERQQTRKHIRVVPLDPNPRILLVRGLGLIAVGESLKAATSAADLYEHTIHVINDAQRIGHYQALPEADLFDMEYWSLEQAKLGKQPSLPLAGQVVLITGAAQGIGAATARLLSQQGAHLYLIDRDRQALTTLGAALPGSACEVVDVANDADLRAAVQHAVETFGGLDGVISNAGYAPQGAIADTPLAELKRSFDVNFFAHQVVASAAVAVMRRQRGGGFLLFNASKAAFNPGPNFGPYALPKATVIALMRQYALELGAEGIRVNAVNADRIRTALLDPQQVAARAAARGLSADDYYRSNLLQREVTADDVAQAFLHLALAEATTGAVLTVDGGNIAAAPR